MKKIISMMNPFYMAAALSFLLISPLIYQYFKIVSSVAEEAMTQDKYDEQYKTTAYGKFAIENYRECRKSPFIGRTPSKAECVSATIDGAAKLHGDIFAEQVKKTLANRLAEK